MTEYILYFSFFFFNDTATTEIYTLSLHDALPISLAEGGEVGRLSMRIEGGVRTELLVEEEEDRKSTRLNSSHLVISYAVFCLKKKKKNTDAVMPLSKLRSGCAAQAGLDLVLPTII